MAALSLSAGPLAAAAGPNGPCMKIAIIGDSTCIPDPGHDAASFLINGKHLVDTGWYAALKMRQYGLDPSALESIIITHFHQDHYIGLPQLLFFLGLKRIERPLTIAAPAEHLPRVMKAAEDFLQIARFPQLKVNTKLIPLAAGDSFELSDVRVESFAAKHVSGKNQPEPALSYKVTDKAGGARFVYSGDTSPHPPLADFARGASVLIHDAAHTAAKDSAEIAKQAGVSRLVLIHYAQGRAERLLQEARAVFPHTELAREGQTLEIRKA